jgi:hypothetical protein
MLNYKPSTSNSEFNPCTKPDLEVITAMKDPGYIINHKRAMLKF